jgi:hypothetical protein
MKKTAMKSHMFLFALLLSMGVTQGVDMAATHAPSAMPWNEIGAKAGAVTRATGWA